MNKKIVREVKLLSRLNHENIVRYYNSWIETTTVKDEDNDDQSSTASSSHDEVFYYNKTEIYWRVIGMPDLVYVCSFPFLAIIILI